MSKLKIIEKEFKCANPSHKDQVEMVICDNSVQKAQRLICKQCQLQQSRAKPLMAFTVAYERAIENQQKLMEQISPTIQANQNYLIQLQEEIQNLKAMACKTLDGLLQNTKEWQESLHQVEEQSATFSLLEVLDKMISLNEQYVSEEQVLILENIHKVNNAFFHKIDSQLNNFFLFKEYSKCQQSLINVILNLNDFTQSKIQLSQDNNLNNAFFKSKAICKEHKKEIIFVNLEENLNKELRSACRQCNRRDGEFLDDFIDQWKEYNQEQNNLLKQELDQLKTDIERKKLLLHQLRLDFVNKFQKGINQLWEILLKGLKNQFQTASNLQMLLNEGLVNDMAEKLCRKNQLKKDDLQLEILQSISNLNFEIQNIFLEYQTQQQQVKENIVVLKTLDLSSLSIGMVFNKDGSKLITSCDSDLILWSFDKKEITKIATLRGHNDYINCVLFNNSSNVIISGCENSSIRIWKENKEKQWEFVEAQKKHNQRISCLILNSKEDELFSGSSDSQICVWKINCENLKIEFKQQLLYHDQDVYSLSLNQSNTYLVSCSFDQKIVIWEIKQNIWKFKQLVENQVQDFGYRVSFLKENMFIWVSATEKQGSINVFQLEDQKFVEQKEKQIQLTHLSNVTDCMYFPIVYNNDNHIAYVKHKKHLYRVKVEEGALNLNKNDIELDDNIVGTISSNGQNLITFNLDQKKLQFLQIT